MKKQPSSSFRKANNIYSPALQNKIRRDPLSYQSDFQQQYQQYQSLYLLFLQNASTDDNSIISLREYIDFVAHCADCYLAYTSQFSDDLINLLSKHHASLEAELREKIVASLVLLRNKNVIDSVKYGVSATQWEFD